MYCVDRHEAEAIVERYGRDLFQLLHHEHILGLMHAFSLTPTIVRGGSLVYIAMNLASGTSATSARESQLVELFRLHQRVSAIGDSPVYVVAMHSSLEWRNFLAELATAAMVRGNDAGGAFAMDMQQPVGMRALLQRITETSSGDAVRIHWSDYGMCLKCY